jgi:hypothetical protein
MQAARTDRQGTRRRWAYLALAATILLALFAAHTPTVSAQADSAKASAAPGLSVAGPQAISLNTAYVYRVTVLTNKSYKGAALWFSAGDCTQRLVVNLVAHRPWHGSFTTALSNIGFQLRPAVIASVVSPPTKKPPFARTLFHRELPLSESATAVPATAPRGPPERCQHFAGS